jgi:hypothetical protein
VLLICPCKDIAAVLGVVDMPLKDIAAELEEMRQSNEILRFSL